MNRRLVWFFLTLMVFSGCAGQHGKTGPAGILFDDRHMRNVTQLTFDGDNGEALMYLLDEWFEKKDETREQT